MAELACLRNIVDALVEARNFAHRARNEGASHAIDLALIAVRRRIKALIQKDNYVFN